MTIRTNPPGAMAYVGKQPVGQTPISTSFLYYGPREIEVVADGYRTERVVRNLTPPWYQIPPLDFISETLWPGKIRDERVIDIQMVPYQPPSEEVLQARADGMRLQASNGLATPIPATATEPLPVAPEYSPSDLGPIPDGTTYGFDPGATPSPVLPNQVPPTSIPRAGGAFPQLGLPQRIPEVGGFRPPVLEPN